MAAWHVALVGATGIVGEEILRVLEERDFPLDQLTLLASRRSAGTRVEFHNQSYVVRPLTRRPCAVSTSLCSRQMLRPVQHMPHKS